MLAEEAQAMEAELAAEAMGAAAVAKAGAVEEVDFVKRRGGFRILDCGFWVEVGRVLDCGLWIL
jgi:hypothetical protein